MHRTFSADMASLRTKIAFAPVCALQQSVLVPASKSERPFVGLIPCE